MNLKVTMNPLKLSTRIRGTLDRVRPSTQSLVLLGLRLSIGWSFVQTGLGKLRHLENTTEFFSSLGIPAPAFHAVFVGGVETIGGVLLMAGFLVPYAALPLAISMAMALATAHREDLAEGISGLVGAEPFPYLAACLTLLVFGGGTLAVDSFLAWRARPQRQETLPDARVIEVVR